MSPFIAEIVGTAMLLLLGNGVVANVVLNRTKGFQSGWIVITFGWGMAVFVAVMITQDFSGGHINPAVTLGLAAAGKFPWTQVPSYILGQMIGAAIGSTLTWVTYSKHYQATEDKTLKLATFSTIPQIRNKSINLFSEILGTFVLLFSVLYLTAPNIMAADLEKPIGLGSLGALPVGLLVFAIGLSLGGTTGFAINPARDLSPRFMHSILPVSEKGSSDWSYSWIPVVGPVFGSLLAAMLYIGLS